MIDVLKSLFRPSPAAREVAPELAVAVLLVEAARADGAYGDADRHAVDALLAEMFDLTAPASLRLQAEAAQEEAADLVRFTRVVKTGLEHEQRVALIEALWRVVLVDHHRDPHEDALLRHLAPLLGLDDRESARARQRVQAQIEQGQA
ncbi:MAG: TerB family tellurite resistance protein [Pararhodobacter sp.]